MHSAQEDTPLAGWRPPPRPARAPLEGRYVRLEPLTAGHVPALHSAFSGHGEVWAFLPYGPFETAADYARWVSAKAGSDDPLFFALVDRASGQPRGVASFLRIAPEAGSIELGHICLAPDIARSRAATEAWFQMMGWAFSAGYRRFEWKCDAANLRSRRAAQRLGLSFEGVFRQAAVVKGRNRDTAWFAAIDGEWPALKQAFETWLAPGNFDEEGKQQQRLSDLTRPVLAQQDPALADEPAGPQTKA